VVFYFLTLRIAQRRTANVSDVPIKKSEFVLIQEALDKLLLLLDSDYEIAGQKYEITRNKLIKFFAWQSCVCPEDLADKTIDRIMAIINKGEEIRNFNSYVHTVAGYVLMEYQRKQKTGSISLDRLPSDQHPAAGQSEMEEQQELERRLKCLEHCMQGLRHKDRELIGQYYQGEKRERIENRERLTKRFGISANALNIQAHRLKNKLEKCVKDCLKQLHAV
jgi:RNA polymerase sigma factor (sigma-70 family)